MLNRVMAACFQQVIKTDDIRFNVHIRMVNTVAHSCLGSEVDHDVEVILGKQLFHQCFITDGASDEHVLHRRGGCDSIDLLQPPLFQADLVVVVHVVERDGCTGGEGLEETDHKIRADEAVEPVTRIVLLLRSIDVFDIFIFFTLHVQAYLSLLS